jgi:YegS/Rv2252/BmrU family lipid kinase
MKAAQAAIKERKMDTPLFIVNPASGGGKTFKHRWPEVERILRARRVEYDSVQSERPVHAMQLAEKAVREGRTHIISVGGDGTLNEVGNGILRGAAGGEVPRLGIIPGGRGSDFHRALGIPHDSGGSLTVALEGKARPIDAGLMHYVLDGREEQRYFFNICGTGFDAEVTARANRMPGFMGGTLPYLLSTLISIFSLEPKQVRMTVDGEERDLGGIAGVVIANGKYYGGGMMISPHSVMDDGLFHIIVMKRKAPRKLAVKPWSIYKGTHLASAEFEEMTGRELAIESRERMLLQPDGEVFGEAPFRFVNERGALRVMSV